VVAAPATGVNPVNFGAVCDGVTDDAPAINAAIQYLRDNYVGGDGTVWGKLQITPCPKPYRILSGINLTGFSPGIGFHLDVDAYGALIQCETAAKACVDALGSRWLTIRGLQVEGVAGAREPKVGIQIGRITTVGSADNIHLEDTAFGGFFTFTPFYNLASEAFVGSRVHFTNWDTGTGGSVYNGVWDGQNHFNITSDYITETITPGTLLSFNDETVIGSDFITGTGGTAVPLYLSGIGKARFISVYVNTAQDHCVELADDNGFESYDLQLDVHCEGNVGSSANITNTVLLVGGTANPTIHGISFWDNHLFATNSVFSTDTSVTNPVLQDVNIHIGVFETGAAKLFDNASPWVVEGRVYVPAIGHWSSNQPNFDGWLTIGTPAAPVDSFYVNNAVIAPANNTQCNPANAVGATTAALMGYACAFTPQVKTTARVTVTGNLINDTTGDGAIAQPFYGTGTAPSHGDACVAGGHNAAGNGVEWLPGATVAGGSGPFAMAQKVTGLTPGTAYWFDVCMTQAIGGTAAAQNVAIFVEEK
jgi:hypothetical protein